MRDTLAIDLETYSSIDLKTAGVYRYAAAQDFEILLCAYSHNGAPVEILDLKNGGMLLTIMPLLTSKYVLKLAYNANFERTCLSAQLGLDMPPEQWQCSAVHAAMLGLPPKLETVAQVLKLSEDKQKMSSGKALIRYFSVPCKPTKTNGGRTRNLPEHNPEKWAMFKEYCIRDVEAETAVRERLDRFPVLKAEQKLWEWDQKINDKGIRVDRKLVEQALVCDKIHSDRLIAEATKLTGIVNPKSVAQIKKWLRDAQGIEVESLNKKAIPEIMANTENKTVIGMLELRQQIAKTSIKKYSAIVRSISADDKVRGMFQFYGANRTGRWCIAEGTPVLVLTPDGEIKNKPIEKVNTNDKVWDGEQWVNHAGVVFSGDKKVITWDGITATPEHLVYISKGQSITLKNAKERRLLLWKGDSPYIK